jgi:type I restriction enzyme R subunit
MPEPSTEADARIVIDDLLRRAGWDPANKADVLTEMPISEVAVAEEQAPYAGMPMADPSFTALRRADYVLLDQQGRSLAVIEAKKRAIEPYTAKTQTLPYAQALGAPFIFLTNGETTYFWDYAREDARIVSSLFSRRDLERIRDLRKSRQPLATVPIPEYYQRQGETRQFRDYQRECVKAIDHAFELGKRRFLAGLPTGTGKTDIICQQIKRLIDAGHVERVLFLVDRDQLAKQALEAIQDMLPAHPSYWLKAGALRQEKQITVALIQTMIGRVREYTSGYFDLVVMDECHRSIYGSWQLALTHFDAIHIGLTATPAQYIERNTFKFYQCRDQEPDFFYRIQDGFKAAHLCPYKFAKGITRILAEGATVEGEDFERGEFERTWTNSDTNRKMMEEFDRLAWQTYRDQAPGQKVGPGKSIVFAITKHHAARLTEILNSLHPDLKGAYAAVITSDIPDAEDAIRRFKRETYPMVAVTVGMLDTGFDCREVLNVVLARPIRSPILYQQIRGRGTRTAPHIGKKYFVIYDFFANHEYFNDSETDIFSGSGSGTAPAKERTHLPEPRTLKELGLEDQWLYRATYVEVGPEGERVDKKQYLSEWERAIQSATTADPLLQKIKTGQPLTDSEIAALAQKLNQPAHYFAEENLRRAYQQPGGGLVDFIRAALGLVKAKPREEQLEEDFRAWLVTKNLSPQQAGYLHLLKNRGLARGQIEVADLFRPPLSALNAAALGVEYFGESGLKAIIQDLNDSVFHDARLSA